jgi:transposase
MFVLSSHQRYYLYREVTDMRKSFNGLSGLVRDAMGCDPLSGDVFVFLNRRGDRMKLLVWDRTGFVLYYKCLERGTFELPKMTAQTVSIRLSWEKLVLILAGVRLDSVQYRRRFSLPTNS